MKCHTKNLIEQNELGMKMKGPKQTFYKSIMTKMNILKVKCKK